MAGAAIARFTGHDSYEDEFRQPSHAGEAGGSADAAIAAWVPVTHSVASLCMDRRERLEPIAAQNGVTARRDGH